ncbi:hypothetical protein VH569_30530 [Azospirillum sp. 11R-A]
MRRRFFLLRALSLWLAVLAVYPNSPKAQVCDGMHTTSGRRMML